jgi:hypothetical protein
MPHVRNNSLSAVFHSVGTDKIWIAGDDIRKRYFETEFDTFPDRRFSAAGPAVLRKVLGRVHPCVDVEPFGGGPEADV